MMRLAGAVALTLLCAAAPAAAQERIARVTDGDTVVTARGERVRIIGLDAPELRGARCPRERRLAEAARAELRRLAARGLHLHRQGATDTAARWPRRARLTGGTWRRR
jgi:endonuclease YncB( thermonuclease family)